MRRTKIVATIGPATSTPDALKALLAAGADVVRLNAAHGSVSEHTARAKLAREMASSLGRVVGVLVDLPGPKMRSGPIAGDEVELHSGATFTLTGGDVPGDATRVSTTLPELAHWVGRGDEIYLADGAIVLRVTGCDGGDVHTEIVRGGLLRSRKGMHVPSAEAHVAPFTITTRPR
jgi:pyruvate kinase